MSESYQSKLYQIEDMMPVDEFWQIIEDSLKVATDASSDIEEQQELQGNALEKILERMAWQDIIKFYQRFVGLHDDLYRDDIWCAGYIMMGGCGDDAFMDFRSWIISRGKSVFNDVVNHPDNLIDVSVVEKDCDYYVFEGFPNYFCTTVFEGKFDEDLYDYVGDLNQPNARNSDFKLSWNDDDEGSMKALCPRLFEMFWT